MSFEQLNYLSMKINMIYLKWVLKIVQINIKKSSNERENNSNERENSSNEHENSSNEHKTSSNKQKNSSNEQKK